MRVRVTRRLAPYLDGIDLSACREGDEIDLPSRAARLLIAEHWAVPVEERRGRSSPAVRASAADAPMSRTVTQLRRVREQMEQRRFAQHEQRREEDRIREMLHDARAVTISAEANPPLEPTKKPHAPRSSKR